jgi:CheY-like chemotaxis protein
VLLDYDMPKLNGAETMAFMRRLSPHTKIVAVTGMDETFLPADFRQGVDHTIFKPFQMEQLLGLINRMVTTYPALAAQSAH